MTARDESEDTNMKKSLRKPVLFFAIMIAACFMLMGCSKEKTFLIKLGGIEDYTLVEYPDGITGGVTDDGVTVTVEKYGDYSLVFEDEEGNKYTVHLNYNKDGFEGGCDSEDITSFQISTY